MRLNRTTWMAAVLGTVAVTGMVGCGKVDKNLVTGKGSASIQASLKLASSDVKSVCVTVSGGVPTPLANPITVPLTGSGLQYSAVLSDLAASSYTFNGGAYASTDCSGTALYANLAPATGAVTANGNVTVVLNLNQVDAPVGLYNEAPVIDTLSASALTIATDATATITVSGHDPDGTTQTSGIKWGWNTSCATATVSPTTGLGASSTVTFTAPHTDAVCQINITATDATDPSLVNNASLTITVGAATATGNAKVVANLNTCPVMTKLTASNLPIKVNYVGADKLTLSANATDVDGDAVAYLWTVVPNATGTPDAGKTCVGTFGDATAKDTTFTLTTGDILECTFAVAVSDGKFADGTSKCTVANHLSLPVGTDSMAVAGGPVLGYDYQSSPTIDNGQTVGFALQVKGGCNGGQIDTAWTVEPSSITITPTTPTALGLGSSPFTTAATIVGTSGNPPAPVVTLTASCHSDPTLKIAHLFTPTAINDSCNGLPIGTDCTAAARTKDKCVLAATCQAAGCLATTTVTCSASTTACQDNKCEPSTGVCALVAATDGPSTLCTDGNLCTTESCVAGECKKTNEVACTDPNTCTQSVCAPSTGVCANSPYPSTKPCDDGKFCTTNDHCDGAGACVGPDPYVCSGTLVCDEASQSCITPQAPVCSQAQWAKDLNQTTYANTSGPDGSMWAVGAMFGTNFDFGNGRPLNACSSDAFVTKYAADGTVVQAWNFGDANSPCYDQTAKGVAVAGNGSVGIIGTFKAEIDFTANGSNGDLGVDYLSRTGSFSYLAVADGSTGENPVVRNATAVNLGTGALTSVGANPTKNIIAVCGNTSVALEAWNNSATKKLGLAVPTAGAAPSGGGLDIVVAIIDATTGNVLWGKQLGGTGDQTCTSITVDYNGDVVLSGTNAGVLTFGGTSPSYTAATGATTLYVAKLSGQSGAYGTFIAGNTFGAQGTIKGFIAVDASNNVAVAGQMTNVVTPGTNLSFGTVSVPYAGGLDAFLVKMNSSLVPTCAFADGDSYDQVANGVGFDSSGNMFVGGGFIHAMPGLSLSQTSITAFDAFEAQFSGTCAPLCIKSYGDVNGTQQVSTLSVANGPSVPTAARNSVYMTGAYSSQMVFDTSPVSTLDTGSASAIHNFMTRVKP